MTYLQPGESYSFDIPYNYIRRSYHATLLQTNDTNGFRIVFQYFSLGYSDEIQIGTGTDPSDLQSVTTTINGSRYHADVYVVTNEMWMAAIGGPDYAYYYINANIVAIDLSTLFNCPVSNKKVLSDVLCDGVYHCDHYEDESACNYSMTYLQPGESYSFDIPYYNIRRFYNATLLQTNETNGFRIVLQDLYIGYSDEIKIGTGTDPSDLQSVITTIYGYRYYAHDVYVETNEMWMAAIGEPDQNYRGAYANIVAFDLSTLFNCPTSNKSVLLDVPCDGVYHCDHYEDESTCNYSTTYLQSGESYSFYISNNYIRRFYNATLLQTNTNGFRIVFQYLYMEYGDEIQIGTGSDPSDLQSIIKTIYGYYYYELYDDIYIETNEMWIAVVDRPTYTYLNIDVDIFVFDISTLFNCPMSNMSVSSDVLCDGVHHCDHYEDESACNYSTTYLQSGESYSFYIPRNYIRRFDHADHAILLQTNDTNGFRIVFQYYIRNHDYQIQIGTGSDPSDPQSIITTIHRHIYEYYYYESYDDIYVETNEMWIAVVGRPTYTYLNINMDIVAFAISTLFNCTMSNMSVSSDVLCDGVYHCDHYEDESACNHSTTYLQSGQSYSLYTSHNHIRRFYNVTLLQTNETNGFRIVFQYLYMVYGDKIQIGTGTDPSDSQSVITTIYGYRDYADDVYVETNEMWMAVIGRPQNTYLDISANIVAFDLSTLFNCSMSNMSVSSDVLCDGVYHCDHYEDESACNFQEVLPMEDNTRSTPVSQVHETNCQT
ncbi:uncharacterized protein LOC121425285 [Lytechinus variegatus]|uniref:uncharacterized protein LOC121425285 n=1 Tax=Lytechinus variegatus TaxID=7654 RepID=UPI001BB16DE1|nr:uncharacterized protein LOC121425285 [Lytechinus variegatus]